MSTIYKIIVFLLTFFELVPAGMFVKCSKKKNKIDCKWTGFTGSSGDFILVPYNFVDKYRGFLELPIDWGLDSEFMSRMGYIPQIYSTFYFFSKKK